MNWRTAGWMEFKCKGVLSLRFQQDVVNFKTKGLVHRQPRLQPPTFMSTIKLPKTKKLVAPFDRGKSLGLLFFEKE